VSAQRLDTRRRTGRRLVLTAAAIVLLAACGDDPPPPAAQDPPVPDSLPGSPPELEGALPEPADLGDAWTDLGAVPLEQRGFPGCPETGAITAGEGSARRGEAQSLYAEGELPAPTFAVSISAWESPDVAQDRLTAFAAVATRCRSFEQELLDGRQAAISVAERVPPPLGDAAAAVVLTIDPEQGPTSFLDTVAVRLGDLIVLTDGERVEGEPDASLEQARFDDLTRQAVEKAQRLLVPD
jgi:hypothetical protein